jgi:hypothetical protein
VLTQLKILLLVCKVSKAEANAYRRLQELEGSIDRAHFLEKHGAQTNLQSQLDRVEFGVNPTTKQVDRYPNGKPKRPSSATRFLSHRDQLNSIQRAQQIHNRAGKEFAERPLIFKDYAGSGFKKDGLQYGHSKSAQVWFNNQGQPITAL